MIMLWATPHVGTASYAADPELRLFRKPELDATIRALDGPVHRIYYLDSAQKSDNKKNAQTVGTDWALHVERGMHRERQHYETGYQDGPTVGTGSWPDAVTKLLLAAGECYSGNYPEHIPN